LHFPFLSDNIHSGSKIDDFVKSRISVFSVIPAEAGIQEYQGLPDPGFRRGDGLATFYEFVKIECGFSAPISEHLYRFSFSDSCEDRDPPAV
jgi:hypothetical protein